MYGWKQLNLPDGIRTNDGVVAEVSQFPLINFHGNKLATYSNNMATRAHLKHKQCNM